MKCCPDYCEECKQHHDGGECPPFEYRPSSWVWKHDRIQHLEQLLAEERKKAISLAREAFRQVRG